MMEEEAYSSDVTVVVTKRNLSTTNLALPYSMSASLQFFLHRKTLCEGPRRCRALETLLMPEPSTGDDDDATKGKEPTNKNSSFRPRIDIDLQDDEFDCFPRLIDYIYTGKPIDETGNCTIATKKLAGRLGVDISQGRAERVESAEVALSKKRKREEDSDSANAKKNQAGKPAADRAEETAAAKTSQDLSPHKKKEAEDSNNGVKDTLGDLSCLLKTLKEDGGNDKMMGRARQLILGTLNNPEQVVSVPGTEWLLIETLDCEVLAPLQHSALHLLDRIASHSRPLAERLGTPQILRQLTSLLFFEHQRRILGIFVELMKHTKQLATEIVRVPGFMDALGEESSMDQNKHYILQILAVVADKCPEEFASIPTDVQTYAADFKWSRYTKEDLDQRSKAIRGMIYVLDDQSINETKRSSLRATLVKKLLQSGHICSGYEVKLDWSFKGVTTAIEHLTEMIQKEALAREMTEYRHRPHSSIMSKLMHVADNPMREALCLFLALLCDAYALYREGESYQIRCVAEEIRKPLIRLLRFGSVKMRIRAALALSTFLINKRLKGSDFEGVGGEFVGALFKVNNLEDGTKWANEAKRKVPLALQTLASSLGVPLEIRNEIGVKLASLVLLEQTV